MQRKTPGRWRYEVVFALLIVAMLALCVRAYFLVRGADPNVAEMARRQQRMVIPLPAQLGGIWARTRGRHVRLATSRQVPSCFIDPSLVRDEELEGLSRRVGRAVGVEPLDVFGALTLRRQRRFAWIARRITPAQADAVRALGHRAVGIVHEWRREYPNGSLAATVVGFRRNDGLPGGGLELSLDRHLAAVDGRRVMLADAARRPIWPLPDSSRAPKDGGNVFLCIDAVIQGHLQRAVGRAREKFDAKWATGVVVNPQTGEVLAMTSAPTFDPNAFNAHGPNRRTNRAIGLPFEPGSVAKPIFAAAAVDLGAVTYRSEFECNGVFFPPRGGKIGDHGKRFGSITTEMGVIVSSNILMAKIGGLLGNARLHAIARRFGFGGKSGIDLPGESAGILRDLRKWDTYSTPRVPFGQELSTTALQMTMAFSALVNGGELLRPRVVDRITDAQGRTVWASKREVVRRAIRPETSRRTLAVLRKVVEHPKGTGKNCRMEKWTSFGKTGTAQIPGPGGYIDGAYTGSFVGGAPATRPALICMISVYWPDPSRGYYGSVVAAPYVRDVLRQSLSYLGVPPDKTTRLATAGR